MKEIKDEVLRQDCQEPQLIQSIADRAGVEPADIRIKFGQRIVHGTLASGGVRRELDSDRVEHLTNAVVQPPTADPSVYERKVPAIEITVGETILFRQERDGAVTQNTLELARDVAITQSVATQSVAMETTQAATIAEPQSAPEQMSASEKAETMLAIAEKLANPIVDSPLIAEVTELSGITIRTNGVVTVLSNDADLIVRSDDPRLEISTEPEPADVKRLQALDQPITPRSEIVLVPASAIQSGAIAVFKQQTAAIEDANTRQFCQNLGNSMQQQAEVAQVEMGQQPTFAQQLIQAKAALSSLKEELVGDVKSNLKTVAKSAANFLSARADAIVNQNMAQSAYRLFTRGAERTDEARYRQGNYEVKRTAPNQFLVSDQEGALMSFQVSGQGAVKLTGKSDRLSREDYEAFRGFRRDEVIPQGGAASEKLHQKLSQKAAQTARDFLSATDINIWDAKDGNYRIEVGAENQLTVTAKDGRGVILQQQGNSIRSRLTPADLEKFSETQQQLDQAVAKTAKTKTLVS